MKPQASPSPQDPLPELLREYFWDCNFDSLRWPKDKDSVIGRILQKGGDEAIGWLRRTAGNEAIARWILRFEGRGLNGPRLRYWELILDLPKDRVDEMIEERGRLPKHDAFGA